VARGSYAVDLLLNLPGGAYKADWIDPASGEVLGTQTFTHQGGDRMFHASQHAEDVARRVKLV